MYFEGCPNHLGLEARIRSLLDAASIDETITHRRVDSKDQARAEHLLGSPTVRVNGIDVEPNANRRDAYGLNMSRVRHRRLATRHTPGQWIIDAVQASRWPSASDGPVTGPDGPEVAPHTT